MDSDQLTPPPPRITYQVPLRPPITTAMVGFLLALGVFCLVLSFAQRGPWAYVVSWLLLMSVVGYGLLATCKDLVIKDGQLSLHGVQAW